MTTEEIQLRQVQNIATSAVVVPKQASAFTPDSPTAGSFGRQVSFTGAVPGLSQGKFAAAITPRKVANLKSAIRLRPRLSFVQKEARV